MLDAKGPAFALVKDLDEDVVRSHCGAEKIWEILDRRFPLKTVEDRTGEAFTDFYGFRPKKGETTASYVGRFRTMLTTSAQYKIVLSDEASGGMLLNLLNPSASTLAAACDVSASQSPQEAMV